MTRKSPVHLNIEKDQPVHLVLTPTKSKVRTSSPKRTPSKRSSSPTKEKPWIPAPCKTSKNKFTWAGTKGQLDITKPLTETTSKIVIEIADNKNEPSLLENADNHRSKVADLSTEIDYLKNQVDLDVRERELDALRGDLNSSLTDTYRRDAEIGIIQDDLLHTELENERLRNSLRHLCDSDVTQRRSQSRLQEEREALLKRLVQAEADSVSAKRELALLYGNIRTIKAEKDVCQEDTDMLSRQRELLLTKCADAEEKNRTLRSELAENQLKLQHTGKLKAEHEKVLDRLSHSDAVNHELKQSLADMDKQISQLSRQIAAEKEEAEAYKHLQKTSELSRSRTEEQLSESIGHNSRLERRVLALEGDLELEKKEHNHMRGILAGMKEKSHNEKEALREKVRSYRDRAVRSEEALEAVSIQLEAKSSKLSEFDGIEGALTSRLDNLVETNVGLEETVEALRRRLYLVEEKKNEAEEDLKADTAKFKSIRTESGEQISRLESRCKQLQNYIPAELLIDYDEHPPMEEDPEEEEKEEVPNYADLNDSLHEVEFEKENLEEPDGHLSPVEEDAGVSDMVEPEISLDGLNARLEEKEAEVTITTEHKDADIERLQKDTAFYQGRLNEAEELLSRYKTDNMMLHQRVDMAERDRSAIQHGTAADIERVRAEYQAKLNELSHYPEKLSSAEARSAHAEAETEALRSQLTDKNRTVEDLNKKIDTFQDQISKLKEKFHSVNEDNIELSNKSQSHERKLIEADMHSKNLMDLVSKKDDTVEQHQLRIEELMRENAELSSQLEITLADCRRQVDGFKEKGLIKERSANNQLEELEAQLGRERSTQTQLKRLKEEPSLDVDAQLANLPPPPASPSTDNNVSEEEKANAAEDSETETGSSSEEEEDVDWSEMLKNAQQNRDRLGLDEMSDGESSVDEDGNRVVKKKEQNGLTSADLMNRMATNQFLGYDEFGRPMNGKYNGAMMTGMKGQKNRAMLFGMDGGKRSKTSGSNNRGAGGKKDRSARSGGGRRTKKAGGNMLLGF